MTASSANKSSVSERFLPLPHDGIDLWLCKAPDASGRRTSESYLRCILARYLQCSPEALCFARSDVGRPYLQGAAEGLLDFNLSHSDDYWLLALTCLGQVGVDIERCDNSRPLERLANRFYTAAEAEIFAALPLDRRAAYFFDCWTLKEALAKASGSTMSATVGSAGFSVDSGQIRLFRAAAEEASKQQFWLFEPETDWHLALCLQGGLEAQVQVNARGWGIDGEVSSVSVPLRAHGKGF
mgnify:CR=1 FL=1